MPTTPDHKLGTLGDLFDLQHHPKPQPEVKKQKRYITKGKAGLDRFAPGTRVRCWWLPNQDKRLHGSIGIVCTEKTAFGRKKYVVIPKAEKRTRIIKDEVPFPYTKMVDVRIEEQRGVLFLTEEEYTLMTVMES
jgi:hypothetical protein